MTPILSAIICTHNPRIETLECVLASLRTQLPLPKDSPWELLLIDNGSAHSLEHLISVDWHPSARVVKELKLGLSFARLRGLKEACGSLLVFIDDDNILNPNYLTEAVRLMTEHPRVGAAGGKSIARYEVTPPRWFFDTGIDLACRDLGNLELEGSWKNANSRTYPVCAPIGAGMIVRREAFQIYASKAEKDARRTALGRKGQNLASGEDNDLVMSLLSDGWVVAYFPQLRLEHIIPRRRLSREYLADYAFSSNKTWVQVLTLHGMCPWRPIPRWTVPLRKLRSYINCRAWAGPAEHIRWRGTCGHFEGLAQLPRPGIERA